MIETGIDEGIPGNWGALQNQYRALIARLPRTAPRQVFEAIASELDTLWSEIREMLESFINSQNLNANESQIERHIQNSKPEPKSDFESGLGKQKEASGRASEPDNVRSLPQRELPLGIVLDACPNARWLVKGGSEIRNWREFLAAVELARPVLGVSPSAWEESKMAMGERQAAITLAAIYQKQETVRSPGGYLRNLTDRAKEGKFSAWPMIMALLRAKLEDAKSVGRDVNVVEGQLNTAQSIARTQQRLEVSESLRVSLAKPGSKQK